MTPFPTIPSGLFDIDGLAVGPPSPHTPGAHGRGSMWAELSWLFDPLCVLAAAAFASALAAHGLGLTAAAERFGHDEMAAAWFAAVLAPFMLRDARFGLLASHDGGAVLAGTHLLRFTTLAVLVLATGAVSQTLDRLPLAWLLTWGLAAFVATSSVRLLVAAGVNRLQRQGRLAEVVAIVGAGVVADRLLQELRRTRPRTVELLGVFDDRAVGPRSSGSAGSVAQLLELGKTRRIDWIVLTLPPGAQHRLQSMVQRLKALSAPIGLCPQHVGLGLPLHTAGWIGERVAVVRLASGPAAPRPTPLGEAGEMLPRWIVTLLGLLLAAARIAAAAAARPLALAAARWAATRSAAAAPPRTYTFDDHDLDRFVPVAAAFGTQAYGYVVTPNADHLIRLHDDAAFRQLYDSADYVLLDSRFLSHLLKLTKHIRLPVCTGSDLTARLFADVVSPDDPLVLVGGSDAQAQELARRYGLKRLAHFNPPMGFVRDPVAVEQCLAFIEGHSPFRFCLLALGSPQQEVVAQALRSRGRARGMALCIGAAINFLTGAEKRAPAWMQQAGLEWLYRLLQAPGRMAGRYLVRGPRVFALLRRAAIVLRPAA